MTVHVAVQPLLALAAGILILIWPRVLNYVVAVYLILVGILGLIVEAPHWRRAELGPAIQQTHSPCEVAVAHPEKLPALVSAAAR